MHLPAYSPRRLTGAAAVACAAALIPAAALAATTSPAAPAGAAAVASTPVCATSGLVIWLNTQSHPYAGGASLIMNFTNLSGHACTLHGYPGVSAASLRGRQLGSPAGWGNAKAPVVTLASGATATASLLISDATFISPPLCQAVTAAGLRVYPPSQTASKVIPFPFLTCSRKLPELSVGWVQKQKG
jgi:Protein of unknown function (DUF4232)